ncbi:MAG: zinc ribbon domain-containing protein [Acidobacteria bacterium]|nr:zinc ribbon domain-containing protein [Acidobacteriota bacterium]
MAQFCTACGTPVEEGLRFCSQCGAAIAAEEPTVANVNLEPSPEPGVTPAPAPTPAPPAAKSSSPILKIVIIVVLVFVLLGIAGIATCAYVAYRMKNKVTEQIKLDEDKKTIEIPTPGGTIKMGESSAETPTEIGGVPVYPGAKALSGGGHFSFGDKFQIGGQEFATDDSVDQVVAFYRDKYGKDLNEVQSEGHYRLSINSGTQQQPHIVTIDVAADADSGKTKVVMTHLGGKEAQ